MNFKKAFAVIMLAALNIGLCFAQSGTAKHVVERGETLASIAKLYSVSEEEIVKLNPDAAQFVYVGMELVLPDSQKQEPTDAVQSETALVKQIEANQNVSSTNISNKDNDFKKWNITYSLSYGFLPKPKGEGVSGSSFSFAMVAGANYNFTKQLYAGARIGYYYANYNNLIRYGVGNSTNIIIDNHYIYLPVEAGYRLYLNNNIALVPYAGLDFSYIVKSKQEEGLGSNKTKKSVKPKDRFDVNGRIGMRISLWGFALGGAYVVPFGDNYGDCDGFFEVSLGFFI